MAVIPSFASFGPQPQLAQSYLGGARVAQAAQEAAANLMIQRERLSLQKQQFEMEQAAKEKVFEAETLRKQHELDIAAAYHQATLGLQERKMEQDAQLGMSRIAETAAHNMATEQNFQERTGVMADTAAGSQALAHGQLQMGALRAGEQGRHNRAMEATAAQRAQRAAENFVPGAAEEVPNLPDYMRAQAGRGSWQYFKKNAGAAGGGDVTVGSVLDASGNPMQGLFTAPGPHGPVVRNAPVMRESPEVKDAREQIKIMEQYIPQLLNGESPRSPAAKKAFPAQMQKYKELKAIVAQARAQKPAMPRNVSTNALPKVLRVYQNTNSPAGSYSDEDDEEY